MSTPEPKRSRTSSTAASSASVRTRSTGERQLHRVDVLEVRQREPDQRAAPRAAIVGIAACQQLARGGQQHARLRRRLRDRLRARRAREVVEAQPQDHRPRDPPRRPQPPRDPVDQARPASRPAPRASSGPAPADRPLAADRSPPHARRRPAAGRDCARARAAGGPDALPSIPTSASSEIAATSPTVLIPRACSLSAVLTPTPHSFSTGSGCRNSSSPRRLHEQQPVRLGHARGDLGQELRPRDADRDRQPDLVAHPLPQPRGDLDRRARDPPHPAHVDERLVDRQPLDHRRRVVEDREHLLATPASTPRSAAARRSPAGTAARAYRARHRGLDPERLRLVARRPARPPPRRSPACPSSRGSSRCSTDAKNESRSAWRMVASSLNTNICSHPTRMEHCSACCPPIITRR